MANGDIKYFSAHAIGPSSVKGTRLCITNRKSGDRRIYPWDFDQGSGLTAQVIGRHHSPFLKLEILWYDTAMEKVFFRTIESDAI